MIKVALSTKPLNSGHKVRGIGSYTRNLSTALEKETKVDLIKFTDPNEIKNVDLIHYPWFDLFFRTLPLPKRIPTVVTVHDVIPLVFPEQFPAGLKGKINLIYQKTSLKGCRAIITDSQNSKKDITKYLGIKDEKIKVIPFAAEEAYQVMPEIKLMRTRNKYKLPEKYLLYVGDVNYSKNLPFLIKAFANLKQDPKYLDFKLILIGQAFLKKVDDIDHPELRSIKEVNSLISTLNLEPHIIRLGFIEVEDLVAIYNMATVYIQPSLYEGFGIPILEAMSCGTPVLCANTSSLPEVGGNAAVYFNPQNIEKFVSVLKDILNDNSLRKKLSVKGIEQASKFSMERVVLDTIKVYEQAIR